MISKVKRTAQSIAYNAKEAIQSLSTLFVLQIGYILGRLSSKNPDPAIFEKVVAHEAIWYLGCFAFISVCLWVRSAYQRRRFLGRVRQIVIDHENKP